MAQIKDLIVTGAARIIGNLYARNIFGNLSGNATTATSATKDAGGNTITNTYIKNLSFADNKLTYTRGDNTSNYIEFSPTGVVTATDSTAGIMKLYGTTGNNTDGTMSQSAITSSLSSLLNDATLTGDCTAPTPDLDDYSNAIATTAFVRDYIEQYVEDALNKYRPDIVIISGAYTRYEGSSESSMMGPDDIVQINKRLKDAIIIPVHMDSYPHCTYTTKTMKKWVKEHKLQERVIVPVDGEIVEL